MAFKLDHYPNWTTTKSNRRSGFDRGAAAIHRLDFDTAMKAPSIGTPPPPDEKPTQKRVEEAKAEVRVPRKRRRYDLREFWLWYERGSNFGGTGAERAVPPPFTLGDIRRKEPPVPGRKWLQWLCIVTAGLLLIGVLWGFVQ